MEKIVSKKQKVINEVADIEEAGIEDSWKSHLNHIKTNNPTKEYYYFIGQVWMGVWKKVDNQETEGAEEKKEFIEEQIFMAIFKYSMMLNRKMAAKFLYVIEGIMDNKNTSAGHMISRITSELLWKVLDASNMVCRYNAACVFFQLYPMAEPDFDLGFDIKEQQHKKMNELLKDDCYQIRIGAIKCIFGILSLSWIGISSAYRKDYLAIIIDELSKDECPEVRLTIYDYLPLLFSTINAQHVVIHALKIIGPRGLNDSKEKNRISAVNMLIKAENKLPQSIFEIIDFEELLASLDIEIDSKVEELLVKLLISKILKDFRNHNVIITNVRNAAETSRSGILKFFCRLGLNKMISNNEAASVICSLIVGALTIMKQLDKEDNNELTMLSLNETLMNKGVDFMKIKTMLDSATLLFSSYAPIMGSDRDSVNLTKVINGITKMIETILDDEKLFKSTILAESALTAASFIPIVRVESKLIKLIEESAKTMPINDNNYSQYLKTFMMWNMEEFITMIENGLYDVAKELKLYHLIPKRKELLSSKNSELNVRNKLKRTIKSLSIALNYAPANEVMTKKFGLFLKKFNKFLTEFVNVIPKLNENTDDEGYWINIYELHTILLLICTSEVSNGNDDYITEEEKENADNIDLDTFEKEYIWFDSRFKQGLFSKKFIQVFINCAAKHFESNQQKSSSCDLVVELTKQLTTYVNTLDNPQEFKKSIMDLKKSALDAAPFAKFEKNNLSVIQEEDEEMEIDQQNHQEVQLQNSTNNVEMTDQ